MHQDAAWQLSGPEQAHPGPRNTRVERSSGCGCSARQVARRFHAVVRAQLCAGRSRVSAAAARTRAHHACGSHLPESSARAAPGAANAAPDAPWRRPLVARGRLLPSGAPAGRRRRHCRRRTGLAAAAHEAPAEQPRQRVAALVLAQQHHQAVQAAATRAPAARRRRRPSLHSRLWSRQRRFRTGRARGWTADVSARSRSSLAQRLYRLCSLRWLRYHRTANPRSKAYLGHMLTGADMMRV